MKFVEELESAMVNVNTSFDEQLSLIDKFMEMASSELEQRVESAELQYLSESNSESATDTLDQLYQEAEEGFSSKVKKAIEKIEEMFQEFISNMRTTVQKFLLQSSVDGKIAKLQKKIMLNPFLRTKSIEYESDNAGEDLFSKIYPFSIRCIAKLNSGADCESELEVITSRISDWEDHKKKTQNKFKAVSVLSTFSAFVKDAIKVLDYIDESGKKILKECKQVGSSTALSVGRASVRAAKISINAAIDSINSVMSSLSSLSKMGIDKIAEEDIDKDVKQATGQLDAENAINDTITKTADAIQKSNKLKRKQEEDRKRRKLSQQKQKSYKKESPESITLDSLAEELFSEFVHSDVDDTTTTENGMTFDSMFESFMESSCSTRVNTSNESSVPDADSSIMGFARSIGFNI